MDFEIFCIRFMDTRLVLMLRASPDRRRDVEICLPQGCSEKRGHKHFTTEGSLSLANTIIGFTHQFESSQA